MSKKIEFEHGGVRVNAGRKAQFSEPTKVIRVPESQVDFIKNWLLNNVKTDIRSDLSASLKVHNVQAKNDRVYRIPLATERVAAGAAGCAQAALPAKHAATHHADGLTQLAQAVSLCSIDKL